MKEKDCDIQKLEKELEELQKELFTQEQKRKSDKLALKKRIEEWNEQKKLLLSNNLEGEVINLKRRMKSYKKEIRALKNVVKAMKKENIRLMVEGDDEMIGSLEDKLGKVNKNYAEKEANLILVR